jgi:hypothetical protein
MQNLAHSASFESLDKDAPSKAGTKHLALTPNAGIPRFTNSILLDAAGGFVGVLFGLV